MSKTAADTTLYRLIEAAHLARAALVEPLARFGLAAGDDAILLSLSGGATEEALCEATGLAPEALLERLSRLAANGMVERAAVGPELVPGFRLTPAGGEVALLLAEHWERLEEALIGELPVRRRKHLRRILKRFVHLLRLE